MAKNPILQIGNYFRMPMKATKEDIGDRIHRFIIAAEECIRRSEWYSSYVKYLTTEIGLCRCALLEHAAGDDIEVEMHHYPLTLYSVCRIRGEYLLDKKGCFSSFELARAVMKDHSENLIGIVALSKTAHELFHAGKLKLSPSMIFGDVSSFCERYGRWINDDEWSKLREIYADGKISVAALRVEPKSFACKQDDEGPDPIPAATPLIPSEVPQMTGGPRPIHHPNPD